MPALNYTHALTPQQVGQIEVLLRQRRLPVLGAAPTWLEKHRAGWL